MTKDFLVCTANSYPSDSVFLQHQTCVEIRLNMYNMGLGVINLLVNACFVDCLRKVMFANL